MLNKQLQGYKNTIVVAKTKVFVFVTSIEVCNNKNISHKNIDQFHLQKECDVTDTAELVIVDHPKIIASDLKERFSD